MMKSETPLASTDHTIAVNDSVAESGMRESCSSSVKQFSHLLKPSKVPFLTGAFTLVSLFAAAASLPTPSHNSLSSPGDRTRIQYNGTVACSKERYEMCYTRKHFDVGKTDREDHEDSFPMFNDQALDQLCSKLQQAKLCWQDDDYESQCARTNPNLVTYVAQADYLCGEGRPGYRQNRDCLTSARNTRWSKSCYDAYHGSLNTTLSKHQYMTTKDFLNEICRSIDVVLECWTNAAATECGREAGEWIYSYKRASLSKVTEYFNCSSIKMNLPELRDGTKTIMFATVAILLTIVGLLGLVLIVRCTGIDHLILSKTKNSTTDRVRGSGSRLTGGRTGRRSINAAGSATKRLIKSAPGERMRFRTIDVGRTVTAVGSDGGALVGAVDGAAAGNSVSGAVKSNWLGPPAVSDSSPGTERTVSEMAGLAAISIGCCGGDSPPCTPLLRTVSAEDDII